MLIKSNTMGGIYSDLAHDMFLNGVDVSPRGQATKELMGVQIELTNPLNNFCYHEKRKFSLKYALVESLLLFQPVNDLDLFTAFNGRMHDYSDDGITLYGAYGYRVSKAFKYIVDKLKSDTESRQAVITIYNTVDLLAKSKDTPCTIALQFLVRNNKLNMITTMRSNDAVLGLPYDFINFTMCQQVIANELGIEVGTYIHQVGSLHVYEHDYDKLDLMGCCGTTDYSLRVYSGLDAYEGVGNMYINNIDTAEQMINHSILKALYSPSVMDTLYHERMLSHV